MAHIYAYSPATQRRKRLAVVSGPRVQRKVQFWRKERKDPARKGVPYTNVFFSFCGARGCQVLCNSRIKYGGRGPSSSNVVQSPSRRHVQCNIPTRGMDLDGESVRTGIRGQRPVSSVILASGNKGGTSARTSYISSNR